MNRKYFAAFEGIKIIFVLFIIVFHIAETFNFVGKNMGLAFVYEYGGVFGNTFFFVSSGFLMVNAYKNRIINGEISFGRFFFGRYFKIYPVYIISELLCLVYYLNKDGMGFSNLKEFLLGILMIPTGFLSPNYPYNVVGWFVSVLLFCYIVFFVICKIAGHIKNENAFLYLAILCIAIGLIIENKAFEIPFLYAVNGTGLYSFMVGAVLYIIYDALCDKAEINKINILVFVVLAVLISYFVWMDKSCHISFERACGDVGFIVTFVILPLILWLCATGNYISFIFALLKIAGSISMQMCFMHLPVLYMYNSLNIKLNDKLGFIVYFVILIAVSIGLKIAGNIVTKSVINKGK